MLNYILRRITNNSKLVHYTFISLKDGVALVFALYTVFREKKIHIHKKSFMFFLCHCGGKGK